MDTRRRLLQKTAISIIIIIVALPLLFAAALFSADEEEYDEPDNKVSHSIVSAPIADRPITPTTDPTPTPEPGPAQSPNLLSNLVASACDYDIDTAVDALIASGVYTYSLPYGYTPDIVDDGDMRIYTYEILDIEEGEEGTICYRAYVDTTKELYISKIESGFVPKGKSTSNIRYDDNSEILYCFANDIAGGGGWYDSSRNEWCHDLEGKVVSYSDWICRDCTLATNDTTWHVNNQNESGQKTTTQPKKDIDYCKIAEDYVEAIYDKFLPIANEIYWKSTDKYACIHVTAGGGFVKYVYVSKKDGTVAAVKDKDK